MNASQKAADKRRKAAEWAERAAAHKLRVNSQRAAFRKVPNSSEKAALLVAMIERAWWLLDAGECEAADALLEFVPEDHADTLFDQFFETENQFNPTLYVETNP